MTMMSGRSILGSALETRRGGGGEREKKCRRLRVVTDEKVSPREMDGERLAKDVKRPRLLEADPHWRLSDADAHSCRAKHLGARRSDRQSALESAGR